MKLGISRVYFYFWYIQFLSSACFTYFNSENSDSEVKEWMWHLGKWHQPRTPDTIVCIQPPTLPMSKKQVQIPIQKPKASVFISHPLNSNFLNIVNSMLFCDYPDVYYSELFIFYLSGNRSFCHFTAHLHLHQLCYTHYYLWQKIW